MEVFLYLLDMNMDLQFILSSCGCIGNKCMVGVGLPLPRRTDEKLCPRTLLTTKNPQLVRRCGGNFNPPGPTFSPSVNYQGLCSNLVGYSQIRIFRMIPGKYCRNIAYPRS